jgi:hypothetical protein
MVRNGTPVDRRELLKAIGVASAAVASASVASSPSEASADRGEPGAHTVPLVPFAPDATPSEAVLAFFGPLRAGSSLGQWDIVAVHDTKVGGIPVVLASRDGVRFQLDVMRRDDSSGAPSAIANTPSLSVFLLNRGDGSLATVEQQGLAAMALAAAMAQRESEGARVPELLSLRERTSRFPRVVYEVVS